MPIGAILYRDQLARASEKIGIALTRGSEGRMLAVLDPYNPKGSTRHVNFITSKPCWTTGARPPKSQISHVVQDSSWESQLAQALEDHPRVIAYAKNQALGFDIPYLDAGQLRRYVPDFLVRIDDGHMINGEPDALILLSIAESMLQIIMEADVDGLIGVGAMSAPATAALGATATATAAWVHGSARST